MELLIIALVAFGASMLTFFSGFGLGTILTPFFILSFPTPIAIALTAIVHLLNNLFKISLIGRHLNYKVLGIFGIAGIVSSIAGAYCLDFINNEEIAYRYIINSKSIEVSWINLIIGFLFVIFSALEIIPDGKKKLAINKTSLIIGGLTSGFFGGLSGHQGALRSIFLLKYGLSKEAFVATGVGIACFIDIGRLTVYAENNIAVIDSSSAPLLITAIIAAFGGALLGKQFLKKITLRSINLTVGILIALVGIAMILGFI